MTGFTQADRQLPHGGEIFLDHVGHFVRDAEAAHAALARAGFTPTTLSIQRNPDGSPTGTGNVCAMFERGYIECLFKTAETPLAREFDAAIARHGGLHLAAFAVADAASAHARLADAGFRIRPLVNFQRPVATEGGDATAAFTVARVEPGEMPEGRIQILTHHTEDAVWQPRWLAHANGALGLASLVIAVEDVAEAAARFACFTGRNATAFASGMTIALDRGSLSLVTPAAFALVVPEVAIPSLPFIGAYGVIVRSLDATEVFLRHAGMHARRTERSLVAPFPPELGIGAWLLAERAADLLV
jgi:Glyoxalase-like domain